MSEDEIITVSTGVQFRLKPVNVWLFLEWDKQMDALVPKVPTIDREDGRTEENPSSPTYQRALARHDAMRLEKISELAVATGIDIAHIPSGFSPVEDDEWTSVPKLMGITIATDPLERMIQWVKFHACPTPEDMGLLLKPIMQLVGTKEEDVQDSLDRFRDQPIGSADKGPGDKQVGRHRNKAGTITRRTRAAAGGDAGS